MREAALGLADLVRSTRALEPCGSALVALLEMLRLALPVDPKKREDDTPEIPPDGPDDDDDQVPPGPKGGTTLDVTPEDLVGLAAPTPTRSGQPVSSSSDPLPERQPHHLQPRLPYQALLAERTEVELATVAASSPAPTREIDVEAAVNRLARALPLREIPLLSAPSIAPGTQILVDVGESMQPFRRDQKMLLRRFRDLAGRSADIRYYADDPRSGAGRTQRRASWRTYSPPDPGRPLIVLTDLGCGFPGRPDAVDAWVALARRLRDRRSSVVAFSPLSRGRLDSRLRKLLSLVVWDVGTTRVGTLRLRQELE